MPLQVMESGAKVSLPVRGAWVEIAFDRRTGN